MQSGDEVCTTRPEPNVGSLKVYTSLAPVSGRPSHLLGSGRQIPRVISPRMHSEDGLGAHLDRLGRIAWVVTGRRAHGHLDPHSWVARTDGTNCVSNDVNSARSPSAPAPITLGFGRDLLYGPGLFVAT
jgi:hypothetical protein